MDSHNSTDHNALSDDALDQTLNDLFAQARAETPSNPALVQAVLARAQSAPRQRRWVVLMAVLAGAVVSALCITPALSALAEVLTLVPSMGGSTGSSVAPLLLLLGAALFYWMGIESTGADWSEIG